MHPPSRTGGRRRRNAAEAEAAPTTAREPEEAQPEPVEAAPTPRAQSLAAARRHHSEMKSFVTHLAAGLLGGLVGVVALAFAWDRLPGAQSRQSRAGSRHARGAHRQARIRTSAASGGHEAFATRCPRRDAGRPASETPPELSDLTDVSGNSNRHSRPWPKRPRTAAPCPSGGHRPADRRGRAATARQARQGARRCSGRQRIQLQEMQARSTSSRPRSAPSPKHSLRRRIARSRARRAHRQARSGDARLDGAIGKNVPEPNPQPRPSPSPIFAPRSPTDGPMPPSSTRSDPSCPTSAISAAAGLCRKGHPDRARACPHLAAAEARRSPPASSRPGSIIDPLMASARHRQGQAHRRGRDRRQPGRRAGPRQSADRPGRSRRQCRRSRRFMARRAMRFPRGSAMHVPGSAPTIDQALESTLLVSVGAPNKAQNYDDPHPPLHPWCRRRGLGLPGSPTGPAPSQSIGSATRSRRTPLSARWRIAARGALLILLWALLRYLVHPPGRDRRLFARAAAQQGL